MQKQTVGLVLLLLFCLSAFAPGLTSAQQEAASPTLKIGSVAFWLFIGPEVNSSYTGPSFFLKNGTLTLTDRGSLGKSDTDVWAGPLAKDPLTFTIKVAERNEELDDANGTPLWSHNYDQPALTLELSDPQQPDLKRLGTLKDITGQTLWSGTLTLMRGNAPIAKPVGFTTETRGWFRYQWGSGTAALLDAQGQTLWSGQPTGNMGLLVRDSRAHAYTETLGIPGPALPPGKVLTVTLTAIDGSVELQDAAHQTLQREPITLGLFTVASNNADSNHFFTPGTQTLVPDVTTVLPPGFAGAVNLIYQTADGKLVETQQTTVTWGQSFRAADGTIMAHMEKSTKNYDADGNEKGGAGESGDMPVTASP